MVPTASGGGVGDIWQCLDVLEGHDGGGWGGGTQWVETGDVAKHPVMHLTVSSTLLTKNYPPKHSNSAEVKSLIPIKRNQKGSGENSYIITETR